MADAPIDAKTRPKRAADVRFRRINERLVLILGAQVYELNETAEAAWKLSSGDHSFDEIVAEVAREYDVEPEQARDDLGELFNELEELGVIRFE